MYGHVSFLGGTNGGFLFLLVGKWIRVPFYAVALIPIKKGVTCYPQQKDMPKYRHELFSA